MTYYICLYVCTLTSNYHSALHRCVHRYHLDIPLTLAAELLKVAVQFVYMRGHDVHVRGHALFLIPLCYRGQSHKVWLSTALPACRSTCSPKFTIGNGFLQYPTVASMISLSVVDPTPHAVVQFLQVLYSRIMYSCDCMLIPHLPKLCNLMAPLWRQYFAKVLSLLQNLEWHTTRQYVLTTPTSLMLAPCSGSAFLVTCMDVQLNHMDL